MTHEQPTEGTAWEISDARVTHFGQFARAHLRTPAQRAAYLALAGAPDEAWSADAVAELTNADAYDVDVALRQFATAGIVEIAGRSPTGDPLYRWHPTMAYLHRAEGPGDGAADPVCGMPVPASTPYTETTDGQIQRFCSLRCQAIWRATARDF